MMLTKIERSRVEKRLKKAQRRLDKLGKLKQRPEGLTKAEQTRFNNAAAQEYRLKVLLKENK